MSNNSYIVLQHKDFRFRKKIAGFDYDHTIVKPKCNSTFSKSIDDWIFLRDNVKSKIQELYKKGYAIVIFTNQSQTFKTEQIKNVLYSLEIPFKAYIIFDKQIKKPNSICFNNHVNNKIIDRDFSFYAGDALGRENDWSDSDKIFANNCNLKYISPEEVFPFDDKQNIEIKEMCEQELIIMVGYPGSGKSTLVKNLKDKFNSDYLVLSGDILKTETKMVSNLKKELDQGNSVIIDSTNPSKNKRSIFINIAKQKNIYVRVIHVTTSIEQSLSQNQNRDIKIPKIAFYVYRKKFEKPGVDENIDLIIDY
mgnify:CR=1 FL=1